MRHNPPLKNYPPDGIDEEWRSLICRFCPLTALCTDYPGCCPVERIGQLVPRAQAPGSELLAALDEARRFLEEHR